MFKSKRDSNLLVVPLRWLFANTPVPRPTHVRARPEDREKGRCHLEHEIGYSLACVRTREIVTSLFMKGRTRHYQHMIRLGAPAQNIHSQLSARNAADTAKVFWEDGLALCQPPISPRRRSPCSRKRCRTDPSQRVVGLPASPQTSRAEPCTCFEMFRQEQRTIRYTRRKHCAIESRRDTHS